MDSLSKNILSTLVYYDVLDYPMTAFEIWKYLAGSSQYKVESIRRDEEKKCSLSNITQELEREELKKHIEEYRGFYFLKGRKDLVGARIEKNKISQRKFKIVRSAVFWLRFVPYVRMIAVTGRLAMKNAGQKSDLDFLVVLKEGKIFTGRLLVTFLIHFLGKRRYAGKIKDRICLNYFITTGSLEIDLKDIFSSSEYSFIFPVFGFETFKKFQKAQGWISDFKMNYQCDETPNLKIREDSKITKAVRETLEIIFGFNFIERGLKKWQMKRIMSDPRTHREGSAVMANDSALVFLPKPHGPEIYEKFREKMEEMKI